jgi:hypothetical protein
LPLAATCSKSATSRFDEPTKDYGEEPRDGVMTLGASMAQGALAPRFGVCLNATLACLFTWDDGLRFFVDDADPQARAGFTFASLPVRAPVPAGTSRATIDTRRAIDVADATAVERTAVGIE